jgi:hypothetical protein
MKWDQHNPEGRGRPAVSDGWMAQFLRREAEKQAEMLIRIRERVERDLDAKKDGVPGKETMRAAKFAQEGFKILATLELEHAKVELLARRVLGKAPMSDDEYAAQLQALGRDGLDALPVNELEAALARRRALAVGGNGVG